MEISSPISQKPNILRTYGYFLFVLYSIVISPFVTRYIAFGEANNAVAIAGILVYIGEFFAFKTKLQTIRVRSEIKRIEFQKTTGKYLPEAHISPVLWFATGMRMLFRVGFILIAFSSIEVLDPGNKLPIGQGMIVFCAVIIEILSLGYLYVNSKMLQDPPDYQKEYLEEKKEDEIWRKKNIGSDLKESYGREEFISDIMLQIYAFMLFTAYWDYINRLGISMVDNAFEAHTSPIAVALILFFMLGAMVSIGLIPMRLDHWIEESVTAITPKEKRRIVFSFILAVIFTCAPSIGEFIRVYF